jgi:type IV pilus assembly protein PilB
MVGFCEEPEMAKLSTQAARDGKKIYFALNASSTFHALQEWIKMVGNNDKVAETLLGITYQKLLRKLCKSCREAYTPDPNLLKKLNLPVEKIKQFYRPPKVIEYDKKGHPILCETCQGTGYYGRTAVLETIIMTDALRALIREKAPINSIRTQCRKDRMLYLQEQALRRVIDGTTSIQEVLRITSEDSPSKKKVAAS